MIEEIKRLRELVKKATPLPWGVYTNGHAVLAVDKEGAPLPRGQRSAGDSFPRVGYAHVLSNAEYIAAACTALPTFLDEMELLLKVVSDMRQESGAYRQGVRDGLRIALEAMKRGVRGWEMSANMARHVLEELLAEELAK